MAAAASMIDLRTQSSFPLRLGSSILKPGELKRWTSVRYNHKPRLHTPKEAKYTVKPAGEAGREELRVRDGKEIYEFSGSDVSTGDLYVLVSKGNGSEKELILERLEACHEFNLIKTPSETDAVKLAAQFPQLSVGEDEDEDIFGGGEGVDEPIDATDPWDYRNYLKVNVDKPRQREALPKANSTANTPQLQSRAASSTPVSRPVKQSASPLISQKKRKAPDTSKANPKRVKAGTEPPISVLSKPKAKPDVPNIQVRKATLRRNSLDDSGELILENETPTTQKAPKQQGSMALALSGQLGPGPISLHSAASSPASRIASPAPERPEGIEEGEEFEFGESSSPEAPVKTSQQASRPSPDDEDEDADADADADADVEDFELPSPAQVHRKSVSAATVTGVADDDDDLDKQLALAMAEEEDEGSVTAAPPRPAESDEESEEE